MDASCTGRPTPHWNSKYVTYARLAIVIPITHIVAIRLAMLALPPSPTPPPAYRSLGDKDFLHFQRVENFRRNN